VTAGRGYNAGSSGITLAYPFTQYTYKPEYVWTYEGFVRAGLGHDISLTGNLFYSRYKDMQLPHYLSALSVEIRNAERVTTFGAELGLAWRPSPKNEVFANVGLLDTRISRYSAETESEGNELPRAPALSLNAGFNFSPDDKFELGADVRYTSAYFSETLNYPGGRITPYAVVNGRIAYSIGRARLFFSVRNLLNSFKATQVGVVVPGYPDYDYATLLPPREISAGVELRF
jgi:outer membrane receptor protein involved in Fe transport